MYAVFGYTVEVLEIHCCVKVIHFTHTRHTHIEITEFSVQPDVNFDDE